MSTFSTPELLCNSTRCPPPRQNKRSDVLSTQTHETTQTSAVRFPEKHAPAAETTACGSTTKEQVPWKTKQYLNVPDHTGLWGID